MQRIDKAILKFLSWVLLIPVYIYKYGISPFTPASCRHVPTCSEYAVKAIKIHGPFKGLWLAIKRISRCHPWGTHGYDPVPPKATKKNKVLISIVVVLFLFSCNSGKRVKSGSERKVITVSILPERTFVKKIAGDDFDINVLIPPGASPAAYTLLPSQLKDISRSTVWFRIGYIGFEYSWKEKIEQANTKMKVVDLSEGLDLIALGKQQHGDHIQMKGVNPHIWLSPVLVKQMTARIAGVLSELNPGKTDEYRANYLRFAKEIDSLDTKIKNELKPFAGREIILFHPSLSYFARDYGLIQFSLESGGKEPTPQHLIEVVDLARKDNIKVIYIQSEFDRKNALVFAEEIGGEVVPVSPLRPDWAKNLKEMTDIIIAHF